MSNFTRGQIIAAVGFVIILISIPLSLFLMKQSQVFKSQAAGKKNTTGTVNSKTVTKAKEVPSGSPLSDLEKLLEGSGAALLTPTGTPNLSFGPTLNLKIALEGRPEGKQTAKVFIGLASGAATTKPTYVLTFTIDFPNTGIFNGLSLAGLNPGSTYTAYIKGPGQIDTSSTFVMSPTESSLNNNLPVSLTSGDLNEDNTINSADYAIAKNLYGKTPSSTSWNERADFNSDGIINNIDLSYVTKNMGKTGASGIWYSSTSTASATPSARLNTQSPPTGGYWMQIP